MELVLRGKCWKFGDNIGNEQIISTNYLRHKEDAPRFYARYLMYDLDAEFTSKVSRGDIIVAGKRFSHGNMHWQPFEAMKFYGLGLIAESMPRGAFRNAIHSGLPVIPFCRGITSEVDQSDKLEVDFRNAEIRNLTRGTLIRAEALPAFLIEFMKAGGALALLRRRFNGEVGPTGNHGGQP
ncbi:MAG: 3-isopropylmalate dehydratase small subunit [Chloroflexi bacterium]|nr:3-isopropylmalate dehydratase small subunit [Chloroflexota bacterium]